MNKKNIFLLLLLLMCVCGACVRETEEIVQSIFAMKMK